MASAYLKAAALLFKPEQRKYWGCCDVISQVVTGDAVAACDEREAFERTFCPTLPAYFSYWGRHWSEDGSEFSAETHRCRVLALCFAAAMAETGDL